MSKISKAQKVFKEHVKNMKPGESVGLTLFWTKSRTWGFTASLYWRGERLKYAGGCGYDKEQSLIETLSTLVTGEYHCSGGVKQQAEYLKKAGFSLVVDYEGKTEHGYTLSKIKG